MANLYNGHSVVLDTADNTYAEGGPYFLEGADFQETVGTNQVTLTLQAVDGTTTRTLAVYRVAAGTTASVELPGQFAPASVRRQWYGHPTHRRPDSVADDGRPRLHRAGVAW